MNQPGHWLLAFASRSLSERTRQRVIEPIVADMRLECAAADESGDPWRRRRVLLGGYWGAVKAIGLCAAGELVAGAKAWTREERIAIQRAFLVGAIAVALGVGALLSNVPIPPRPGTDIHRLSMLLVPGHLFVALPLGVAVGIFAALRCRSASLRLYGACLLAGVVCTITMLLLAGWVVPLSNQAFRRTMLGRPIEPGYQELTLSELIARERDAHVRGLAEPARLARQVTSRRLYWSFAGVTIALGAMAASAAVARRRTLASSF